MMLQAIGIHADGRIFDLDRDVTDAEFFAQSRLQTGNHGIRMHLFDRAYVRRQSDGLRAE